MSPWILPWILILFILALIFAFRRQLERDIELDDKIDNFDVPIEHDRTWSTFEDLLSQYPKDEPLKQLLKPIWHEPLIQPRRGRKMRLCFLINKDGIKLIIKNSHGDYYRLGAVNIFNTFTRNEEEITRYLDDCKAAELKEK